MMFVRSLVTALVNEFLVGSRLLRGMCDHRSPAIPQNVSLPQRAVLSTTLFSLYLFDLELEISGIQNVTAKHKQSWIDHLERMDNTRLPKHAFNYKPRGRRAHGRPRK